MSVVIETTVGDLTVDLYLKERPNTCLNFLKLCKVKYYNLCIFHKVERNFIAQTGDPTSTGRGGESIFTRLYGDQARYFEAELKPRLKHEKLGTLSMVNNGNNMNGSQFFLTLSENLTYLDEVHTVFGEVVEGFDILLKINEAICDPNNRPYQDIRITHTVVLQDPYDDPSSLEIPDASPEPTREQLESNYIGADEDIDDNQGKTTEEIEEKIKESEAKARATILEMVGDLPDAEVKPPENVLFVCKLNPVTTAEDLEIIFSRFGPITSCEVIKDKKTGESLQYAFIEFENEEDCENAYFKMDNVLIDDRRIHVDFSQSVSKLTYEMEKKSSKGNFSRSQNFVLKDSEKKSDGYNMIFDMDDSVTESSKKEKDGRSWNRKYQNRDSPFRGLVDGDKKESRDNKYFRESKIQRNKKYEDYSRSRSFKEGKYEEKRHSYTSSKSHNTIYPRKSHDNSSSESDSSNSISMGSSKKSHPKRIHRHDSSSSHSISPPPSKHKQHSSKLKHYLNSPERDIHKRSKKGLSSVLYKNKEQSHASSRHWSRSPESASSKQTSKTISSRNRASPESVYLKKNESKRFRSPESVSPKRTSRPTSSRNRASPELIYFKKNESKISRSPHRYERSSPNESMNWRLAKSKRRSRSNSSSQERNRSSKKHTSKFASHSNRSSSRSPDVSRRLNSRRGSRSNSSQKQRNSSKKHTSEYNQSSSRSPDVKKTSELTGYNRKRIDNSYYSSDSELERKSSTTKDRKEKSSCSKTLKHSDKKHKHRRRSSS